MKTILDRKSKTFTQIYDETESLPKRYYTPEDIIDLTFQTRIAHAKGQWVDAQIAYVQKHMKGEDKSGCVIGDGIQVYLLRKGERIPKRYFIIKTFQYQGGVQKEATVGSIVDGLKKLGIECWYNVGSLD